MEEISQNNQKIREPFKKDGSFNIISIAIIVFITIGVFYIKVQNPGALSILDDKGDNLPELSPTVMPFEGITIPALRKRVYVSSLGKRELYDSNSSYTAYLTHYDSDGLRINGLLTVPNGKKPESGWPAIIFIHGYIPPNQYQTTQKYVDYVNYLAENEFVVLKIDLRGHGTSEGTAGGGYYGADYVIDTLNARAALQKADFVNPDKIGLWGHSMAGNIVMRSMVIRPEIPAAVIWAGAVYTYEDMLKYRINDNSYQRLPEGSHPTQTRQRIRDLYGDPDLQNPFWKQMSPVTYLSDLQGAVQLNHAVDDTVVNIGYSRDLAEYLKRATIPYELHEYSTGGHNVSGQSFNEAMANTVAFFNMYL